MIEVSQFCVRCLCHIEDGKCPQCGTIYNLNAMCKYCGSYLFGNPCFKYEEPSLKYEIKYKNGICSNPECFGYKKIEHLHGGLKFLFKVFPNLFYEERKYSNINAKFVFYDGNLILVSPRLDDCQIHHNILISLYNRFWS